MPEPTNGNAPAPDAKPAEGVDGKPAGDVTPPVKADGDPPEGNEPSKPDAEGDNPPPKDGEGDKDPPKVEGAPEKYEDFKVPEGMVLSDERKGKFSEHAKALGLTQESAQKALEFMGDHMSDVVKDLQKQGVK